MCLLLLPWLSFVCAVAAGLQQQQCPGDAGQRQHPVGPSGLPGQGVGAAQLEGRLRGPGPGPAAVPLPVIAGW